MPLYSSAVAVTDIVMVTLFVLVQVEDGQIQRMEVLHNKGAGPQALYEALGGKMPATV